MPQSKPFSRQSAPALDSLLRDAKLPAVFRRRPWDTSPLVRRLIDFNRKGFAVQLASDDAEVSKGRANQTALKKSLCAFLASANRKFGLSFRNVGMGCVWIGDTNYPLCVVVFNAEKTRDGLWFSSDGTPVPPPPPETYQDRDFRFPAIPPATPVSLRAADASPAGKVASLLSSRQFSIRNLCEAGFKQLEARAIYKAGERLGVFSTVAENKNQKQYFPDRFRLLDAAAVAAAIRQSPANATNA